MVKKTLPTTSEIPVTTFPLCDLSEFLLQHVVDVMDIYTLARCLAVNHRFQQFAKSTLVRIHQGKHPSKIALLQNLKKANNLLIEDIKASSDPHFIEEWNKHVFTFTPATDYEKVKIIMFGHHKVGASTLLRLETGANCDLVYKPIEFENHKYKLQMWDKFEEEPLDEYLRFSFVVMVLYDSSLQGCKTSVANWLDSLFDSTSFLKDAEYLFVGTKADIQSPYRISTEEMAEHIKTLREYPFNYLHYFSEDLKRYPYVIETRQDDVESIHKLFRLAAYMGIRAKKRLAQPVVPPPTKTSLLAKFKKMLK